MRWTSRELPKVPDGEMFVRCKVISPHIIGFADVYFDPRFGWVLNQENDRFPFAVLMWEYFDDKDFFI